MSGKPSREQGQLDEGRAAQKLCIWKNSCWRCWHYLLVTEKPREEGQLSGEARCTKTVFRGTAVDNVDDTYDDFGKPNWNSLMERILHTNLVFRWTAIGNVTAAHQWQTLRTHRSWSCATLHNNHMFSVKAVMIHANGTGKFCKNISNGMPSCIPASPDTIHSEQKSSKNCRLKQFITD